MRTFARFIAAGPGSPAKLKKTAAQTCWRIHHANGQKGRGMVRHQSENDQNDGQACKHIYR